MHLTPASSNTTCRLMSQIFPRHVLEAMSTTGGTMGTGDLAGMARSHNDVSILFMDICGALQKRQLAMAHSAPCCTYVCVRRKEHVPQHDTH